MVDIEPVNYGLISGCESDADNGTWGANSLGTENNFLKEGANCLGCTLRTVGSNIIEFVPDSAVDLSGTKHLRIWYLCSVPNSLETEDNGGVQFYLSDGSNTGYYNITGRDTYPGGWYNLVVDLSRAVDSGSKPTAMNAITNLGINQNMISAPKNVDNTWIDNFIYCDGLQCSGSTQFDLQDIYDVDNATGSGQAWGIIRKISGIYYLVGSLIFGDDNGVGDTDFLDYSQVAIFEDRKVSNDLYKLVVVGNATGTTSFQLGNKSGDSGIQGCVVKALATGSRYEMYMSGSNIDALKLYGSTFSTAGFTFLPQTGSAREVLNCSFEESAAVAVNDCTVMNCKFISSTGSAVLITGSNHNLIYSEFIACPLAVEISESGSDYYFDGLIFSGNTYDVYNSSADPITVTCRYGSNANYTTGSSVTIENPVTLTLTGLKVNSEVTILEAGTTNELDHVEDSGTTFGYDYTYSPSTYIDIYVHHVDYIWYAVRNYELQASNANVPIAQVEDRNYSNP